MRSKLVFLLLLSIAGCAWGRPAIRPLPSFGEVPPSDIFGVCVTPYWPDAGNNGVCLDEKMAADIQRIGARWMRAEFIAGKDEKIKFPAWDEIIQRASDHEISITGLLDYSTCPAPKDQWPTPEYRAKFVQTAVQIVDRYKRFIKRWEIWNEPNFADFRLDPEPYAELLAASYEAIKKVDPDSVISLGGLAGAWSGSDDTAAKQYLQAVYKSKACQEFKASNRKYPFDIVSVHPYAWDKAPSEYLASALRDNIVSVMAEHGEKWKPIWLTELGWDTDPKSPTKMGADEKKNEERQAAWLAEMYDLCDTADRGKYGKGKLVNRAFYFCYFGGGFALRDWGGRARPAYYAYARAATGLDLTQETIDEED
jgi:hypothetical protein